MQTMLRVLVLVSAVFLVGRTTDAQTDPAQTDPAQTDPAQTDPAQPDLLGSGQQALAESRFTDAERIFRQLTLRQPGLVDAYRGLAQALASQSRTAEAADVLRRLGEGMLQAGHHDSAVGILGQAAELQPNSARLQALLGKAHLFAQNHLAAAQPLRRALELGSREATTRLYLAAALWEIGRPTEAETLYVELLKKKPGAFVALHQLGRLLHWRGRSEEAISYLRRAAVLRSGAADVAYDLAQALASAGQVDDAIDAFRRALTLAPGNYKAHYGLARLLARRGELDAARESMSTYQKLYATEQKTTHRQGLERAQLDRGWEFIDSEAWKEAIQHFERLAESSEALAGIATAWSHLGDHLRAVGFLERAVSLAPDRQDLRLMLAEERMATENGTTP